MSDTMNLDDLELELRKLPGVRAAGFTEREDLLLVQVQVAGDDAAPTLSQQAARIAYRHADKPVALEVVKWRTAAAVTGPPEVVPAPTDPQVEEAPPAETAAISPSVLIDRPARVRLLAVLTFPDTDELEVHLTYEGRRVIGRATASTGVSGAVGATLEGLQSFFPELDLVQLWTEELAAHEGVQGHAVATAIRCGDQTLLGLTAGNSRIEAAARATLHALNRAIEEHLAGTA